MAGPVEATLIGNLLVQSGALDRPGELRAVVRASNDLQTFTPGAAVSPERRAQFARLGGRPAAEAVSTP